MKRPALTGMRSTARNVMRGLAFCLLIATAASGQLYKVLTNFDFGYSGGTPAAGLVFDSLGNLYGTEFYNVSGDCQNMVYDGCGGVFELTPNGDGTWSGTQLYGFMGGSDGGNPLGPLVLDQNGNLYGTTTGCCGSSATAFELVHPNGVWTKVNLYTFGGIFGTYANGLTFNRGHLYGTTALGGLRDDGVAFTLGQISALNWYGIVIHRFSDSNEAQSSGPLIFDAHGSAYGTALLSAPTAGDVFKLTPNIGGAGWTETVLHGFQNGVDGNQPMGGVTFDAAGNLYGTTFYGGASPSCNDGCGIVFKLTPNADGTWTESIIHTFHGGTNDGARPMAGVTLDPAGIVYGTTSSGGLGGCGDGVTCGVVFKLTPGSGGQYSETILHFFSGGDGAVSMAPVIRDSAGNLYGTTFEGGSFGRGVVFEITP
jgi:uncharacterized repeat protein (TIGR03803 family)